MPSGAALGVYVVGERTTYGYDALGRQTVVLDEKLNQSTGFVTSSRTETTTFDSPTDVKGTGQVSAVTMSGVTTPEGTIRYEYDPATGRKTRMYTESNDTRYGRRG